MSKKLNLQLLAEEAPQGDATEQPKAAADHEGGEQFTAEQLSEIEKIATKRSERAQASALKDYFQQQGLDEEQAKSAIEKYKTEQANKLTPEAQRAIDEANRKADKAIMVANKRLVEADAKSAAAELGARTDRIASILKLAELPVEPDAEQVKQAVEKVLTDYPEWKKSAQSLKVGADEKKEEIPDEPVTIKSAVADWYRKNKK